MKPLDPDEKIFSIGDIAALFQEQKKKLCKAALLCGALGALYGLIQPVKYRAEASFKESAEQKGDGLLGMLGSFGVSSDNAPQAAALMKSNLVLKPLVSEFGLQIFPPLPHKLIRAANRVRDNLCIARGLSLEDPDGFGFSDVVYDGEKSQGFQICFSSPSAFTVSGGIEGRMGKEVFLGEGISFRLTRVPGSLQVGRQYSFSISPWIEAAEALRNSLSISPDKVNRSICLLSLAHRNRHLAAQLLNALMIEYQNYLKEEHDRVAEAQLAFLVKRQDGLYVMLQKTLDEHMDYLRGNFKKGGFLSLEEEMKLLSDPHADLYRNAFRTDFALELIDRSLYGEKEAEDLYDTNINDLQMAIFSLESQRDLLRASLALTETEENHFGAEQKETTSLERVRSDLWQTKAALSNLESELPFSLDLCLDPNKMVQSWAKRIGEGIGEKSDLELYLRNLVRLYSVQEKILCERQFQKRRFPEFDGIDLSAAESLLAASRQQLDRSRESIEKHRHFSKKLEDSAFEIASLNAVFNDAVSQNLLRRAAEIHLALSDGESHSGKETERYLREMNLQRRILAEHLKQMAEMEEMLALLSQDKIAALQQVSVDRMQHQISVNEEKIADLLKQKEGALVVRKDLLQKKMGELRLQMASSLPEKWRVEHLLQFKSEMGRKMMESIGQLVESKTIGHHLHHVESKPLDRALSPMAPQKPKYTLFIAAGALLGAFGVFILSFFRKLYSGFPATLETLQALRYPVSGAISFAADGPSPTPIDERDLETLRKWILTIDQPPIGRTLSLLGSKGPDYSHALAELLSQSGRRVLLIRCDFASPCKETDRPGLLQALENPAGSPPIQQKKGYSFLPTGGTTRYGTERIASPQFSRLLELLHPSFDHILLYSRGELASAETEALLRISDKAAATIAGESIEVLTPLVRWAYHEERTRLTFFVSSRS